MKVKFKYINMGHWGNIHLLPCIDVVVQYNIPTIEFKWWIWRVDMEIYKRLPDWFMKYVWNSLNFDFSWMKKKDEKEDY